MLSWMVPAGTKTAIPVIKIRHDVIEFSETVAGAARAATGNRKFTQKPKVS